MHISSLINNTWKASSLSCCSEDKKLIRIVLMKTNREAGNCWQSLLEGEYAADPWVQDQMQRKLTLERFQREVALRSLHRSTYFVLWKTFFFIACLFTLQTESWIWLQWGRNFWKLSWWWTRFFQFAEMKRFILSTDMGYFYLWPFFVWN